MCPLRFGEREAIKSSPPARRKLGLDLVILQEDGVVPGLRFFAELAIDRIAALWRNCPISDNRHHQHPRHSVGKPEHGPVRIYVRKIHPCGVRQIQILVYRAQVGPPMRQNGSRRSKTGVELLSGRRRVANPILLV